MHSAIGCVSSADINDKRSKHTPGTGVWAQTQTLTSPAAHACTNDVWSVPFTFNIWQIAIPRKSLYIAMWTSSFIETTTWRTWVESIICLKESVVLWYHGENYGSEERIKLESGYDPIHRSAGTEWSFCRFTYRNLVTTSPSSEYHGLPTVSKPAAMLARIWAVSQVTLLVGATGGVYKRQGLVRHEMMTLVYLEFLVYRPK